MTAPATDTHSAYRFAHLPTAELLLSVADGACLEASILACRERTKPVVVIDTNVWLDLLYWHDKESLQLKERLDNEELSTCITLACLEELADVIARKHFYLEVHPQHNILKEVLKYSTLICPPQRSTARCRDTDDQKFLDLAQAVSADFLITKDKLVLKAGKKLKKFGILTLSPDKVIQILDTNTISNL